METLPPELLHKIFIHVREESTQDLSCICQVNKTYFQLAAPICYADLTVTFRDKVDLEERISELSQNGLGRQYLKYARKLEVMCVITPFNPSSNAEALWRTNSFAKEIHYSYPKVAAGPFFEQHLTSLCVPGILLSEFEPEYYEEKDWGPLVLLLSRLQHVVELNYSILNMFPPCLYQAIQNYHPTCRINIFTFQSPSLDLPGMGRPGVSSHPMYEDPFELEVLRFPGLRAFAVEYDIGLPGNAWQDFSQVDEILPLLAMSPNLKHLAVNLVSSSIARVGIDRIKREWGQFTNALKPYPAAHLESLAFDGPDGVNPWEHALLRFGENLDLSYLRSLDIHVYSDPDALRQAALMLNNLEQLSITVDLCGKDLPDLAADNEDMISAIQHFRPLKFLCLRAVRTVHALHGIVSHHGPTLESFVIQPSEKERMVRWKPDQGYKYPVLNDDDILWLAETCPNIQELSIPLKRFGGSPTECGIYKAIGKFKWLHSLILNLHCDCQHGPANTHSTDSTPYLQKMFKNAATDKHLVSAIWKIIISNQSTQRLRNMCCVPFGANLLPQYEKYVINQLSPNFLARGLDSHTLEPLEVVEIGKEGRMCLQEEAGERFREPVQLPQRIRVALDNLWPPLPGRRYQHWLTRWKSFPLQPHERSVG